LKVLSDIKLGFVCKVSKNVRKTYRDGKSDKEKVEMNIQPPYISYGKDMGGSYI